MEQNEFKIYNYRWVVISAFMFIVLMNQVLWITFASITSTATSFYKVSDMNIGLLSLSFMLVYIIISVPASWVIDTFGIHVAVGIGAALTGIFGILRGVFAANYSLVLFMQIGIAVGQPFIVNAMTTVAAHWFPIRERATATGLGSLSVYLGIIIGLALTPWLTAHFGLVNMLMQYGIASLIAAILFLILVRERPQTPPCPPEQAERSLALDGLKNIIRQRNFILLMVVFFIGLGVFNAVTTWIEDIIKPRHFSSIQAGIVGGIMVVGGVVGAIFIPPVSDRLRKRVPFIFFALAGTIPGLIGITYATSYWLLLASAFLLGFCLLSSGPVGFQYGAEITYPAPEGTSNGMVMLMGQIAGIIFIFGMDSLRSPGTGSMTFSLLILIGLVFISMLVCTRLKESKLLTDNSPK
jgi:sugar phosphate permease